MENIVASTLTALVVGAISALLTAWLALRRFRSEKWWERKVAAYERVIESLHHRMAVLSEYIEQVARHKEISPDRHDELTRLSRCAHLELDKAADIGVLYFSREASERLRLYRNEVREAEPMGHSAREFFESMMAEWKATESCLSVLLEEAKKDLRIE